MLRRGLSTGLFLAVLAAAAGVAAGAKPQQVEGKRGPKAVFEETFKDLGAQHLTQEVEHAFPVRNEGDAVLRIEGVFPSCDCTVVDFTEKIKPGETGTVTLRLKGEEGPYQSYARVQTNEPEGQNEHRLELRVLLMGPIEFDPEPFVYFEGPSPPKWQVVHIRSLDPHETLFVDRVVVTPGLRSYVDAHTEPVKNEREYAVVLTLLKLPPPGERVQANVQVPVRRSKGWRNYDIQVRIIASHDSPPQN
ncbi:MAG: DUF1573 domain-containing protein [Acidobacteriota bacterium]|nr:MAG: DUF1573 domain-containing protein [Acidobacteriota bacterium]